MISSQPVIQVENIAKRYKLGTINRSTFADEIKYRWLKLRGRDPAAALGKTGQRCARSKTEDFWALKGVSFEVKQGEVIGLIGGNGSGKSTILKILSRITEPTSGSALIRGRVGSLLEVGTGFHPELTGRENIYMNGTILGMKRHEIDSAFDAIVDFSGVENFLDTPVKRYSSGMYVRLAFAVAAHLEPEIMLIDEVLAVGDAAFQKKCLGKMSEVARGGRTIIFVSHNMAAVQSLCDSCIWISNGTIQQTGPCEKVVENYTRETLAKPSEQQLSDRVDRDGNRKVRATDLSVTYDHGRKAWSLAVSYESGQGSWNNARVTISINRATGGLVTYLDSSCIREFPRDLPSKGTIQIDLSSDVLFCPGEYFCNLALIADSEMCDHIVSACVFNVPDAPIFDWTKVPETLGTCFINQKWKLSRE